MAKNYIINNVLCFLHSAKKDYADEALFDVLHSFYSVEDIKSGKCVIGDILNKEPVNRRDPERKRKEIYDLIEYYEEFSASKNNKDIFVSNSYKKMPPIGLEFIAPLLSNLNEEVAKINSMLPKIIDIRSEVYNTADTVRNMKVNLLNIESKFSSYMETQKPTTPISRLPITPYSSRNTLNVLNNKNDGNISSFFPIQDENTSSIMSPINKKLSMKTTPVIENINSDLSPGRPNHSKHGNTILSPGRPIHSKHGNTILSLVKSYERGCDQAGNTVTTAQTEPGPVRSRKMTGTVRSSLSVEGGNAVCVVSDSATVKLNNDAISVTNYNKNAPTSSNPFDVTLLVTSKCDNDYRY